VNLGNEAVTVLLWHEIIFSKRRTDWLAKQKAKSKTFSDSDSDSDSILFNVSLLGPYRAQGTTGTHCVTEPQVVPEGNAPPQSFSPPDSLAGSPGPLQKVTAVMPVQTRDFKK
jgi:hypothetical protein